jgi:hypothetical protein
MKYGIYYPITFQDQRNEKITLRNDNLKIKQDNIKQPWRQVNIKSTHHLNIY